MEFSEMYEKFYLEKNVFFILVSLGIVIEKHA
jgi:hypothetical protein